MILFKRKKIETINTIEPIVKPEKPVKVPESIKIGDKVVISIIKGAKDYFSTTVVGITKDRELIMFEHMTVREPFYTDYLDVGRTWFNYGLIDVKELINGDNNE